LAGTILAWLISVVALLVGVLCLGIFFSAAQNDFYSAGLDSDHARAVDAAARKALWGVGAGAIVFGACANPILLRNLGGYWPRVLIGAAAALALIAIAYYTSGAYQYPL